jgi:hypothetical protein
MALDTLHLVAPWAGATSVVALLGCIIAAALGVQFSTQVLAPAADAFDLARLLALVGGTAVIVAGMASTCYWWRVGVASGTASVAIGCGLVGAAVLFAAAARALLAGTHRPGV